MFLKKLRRKYRLWVQSEKKKDEEYKKFEESLIEQGLIEKSPQEWFGKKAKILFIVFTLGVVIPVAIITGNKIAIIFNCLLIAIPCIVEVGIMIYLFFNKD